MKAAQITEYGSADNIEITDTDKPAVKDGHVLVAVRAASLNPFDVTVREGYVSKTPELPKPITLGSDIAGIVEAVGVDVTDLKVGDKVYGQALTLAGGSGALAEYAEVPADKIGHMPDNIDFNQAASLPLVGVSSIQAIYEHIQLKAGQKILIHGGTGGIGTAAIQIAKHIGAYVSATARGDKTSVLKNLGADDVIDTDQPEFLKKLSDYDAVLNLVRNEDFNNFYTMLKNGATIVTLTGQPEGEKPQKNITIISQMTVVTTERLNTLKELVEAGAVKPQIAEIFPLQRIRDAFKALETGGQIGKIVVSIG